MKNKLYISVILIIAIVLVVNLIVQSMLLRFDLTEDRQFTLSNPTKDLLKQLSEPVTVKAYFSEDLPPEEVKGKNDFKDILTEYNKRSKGMVVYSFVNPNAKEDIEQEALQAGVQPRTINTNQKDQFKLQKIYTGAVITMGEKKEIIPLVQPGTSLEYSLSKAIKKLSVTDKPSVGILQGHGEPSIQEIIQVYNEMSILYNIEPLTLTDSTGIPERIKALIIIKPKDTIPEKHLLLLDNFLAQGGRIFIAYSRVNPNYQTAYGASVSTGLESWLKGKGITISDNVVIDASCSAVQVVQQQAGYKMVSNVQFPYAPIIKSFAKHPINGGLEAVFMPFASTIEYVGDSTKKFIPLAFTSDKSGAELLPVYFNVQREWTQSDFNKKKLVVAAAFEGKLAGNSNSKLVIVADADFIINGTQNQSQQLNPDNINLMANSIDWLSDDTGLIGLRTKTITSRPVKDVSDATALTIKWLNFLLPVFLVIAYGFIRTQIKRNQRIKRMEENYV